jgi:hypothetical protein
MGCGCKKNQTNTSNTQKVNTTQAQTQKSNDTSIQESIRKVVEKYYKK